MLTWMRNILPGSPASEQRKRRREARITALQAVLGQHDGTVWRSPSSLRKRGYADVLRFRKYVNGIAYVTSGLIGNEHQVPNRWGHYELMLCMREENDWAPAMLSQLAHYTHDATLQPGDTMDIADAHPPQPSVITALLFARADPPADSFDVSGAPANIILCIGITATEFAACKNFGSGVMLRMLREKEIYPFTDLQRDSIT
jgi:Suppressor of fused protein (SUFU)